MTGFLLLLGLLACPMKSTISVSATTTLPSLSSSSSSSAIDYINIANINEFPIILILSELCYYPINEDYIDQTIFNVSFKILSPKEFCNDPTKILNLLSISRIQVLASLKPELCNNAIFLSHFYNASLITWNCPLMKIDSSSSLSPSITEITRAFAKVVVKMKWKSIAIIASRRGWWPTLVQHLDEQLRQIAGVMPRYFFYIDNNSTRNHIEKKLSILHNVLCQAVILCLPADSQGRLIFDVINNFQQNFNFLIIAIDVSNLPSWGKQNVTNNMLIFDEITSLQTTNLSEYILNRIEKSFENDIITPQSSTTFALSNNTAGRIFLLVDHNTNYSDDFILKIVDDNLDEWLLKQIQSDECEDCPITTTNNKDLTKILNVLMIFGCSCLFVIVLLGAAAIARNQLLKKRVSRGPYKVLLTATDFVFPQIADSRRVNEGIEAMLCCWLQQLQEFGGPEVEKPDLLQGSGTSLKTPLRGGSSPNLAKQLIVDSRVRYNGDLVQMKAMPPSGSGGNVELKSKTVELLVLLHGLRHENLNPLIGCLAEPPRPALVSEYCARGSLQDVLQQDDIKLDWSFRLSLLTDLVRGMKYLHSTPIRVHGYLTSRNCVIDARWVLKVTDYGLPAFYEAQGVQPINNKSARELLWTAPEHLRHASLRRKGTQPGDVYSFGIIMQEVVVRGEPFCMLALTPEEIIEKVKRPPPLIRPSVSKGAAPPEAINIMRQCWAEQAEMRPDFNAVHDQFKKLNHGRKVNIVDTMFQMLEKYSNNLEELIRERTEQLDIEKKKTEQLLNRMLPSSVAEKLKLGMPVDPEEFEDVTIYFSDIVGFTTISAHSTPFQVVDLLNDLYTCFDATINAYSVYKVETIGDAYMVVSGLPVRVPDHAEQVATMALDLLHQSGRFRIQHLPGTPLRLRIGLHSGPCCAGVVGLTMPRYCLFGDTVNTASRMESTGAAWRIHLSEATKEHLERAGGYQLEYRGPTEIKGKGTMQTYWLLGKSGFDKLLPVPPPIEESHGLDESLIIATTATTCLVAEESATATIETDESRLQTVNNEENSSKSVNPTFIKFMEQSKFSTLVRTHHDELIARHDYHMVKSTSTDTPLSLGTPVSATEVAAALLGASTSSLSGFRRHRKIEEEDLSTPYNHYKCLSPKQRTGKLLRQFSLDRTDEHTSEESNVKLKQLCKQNSAGAADLEKIEEVPHKPTAPSPSSSQMQCPLSISVDSLMH